MRMNAIRSIIIAIAIIAAPEFARAQSLQVERVIGENEASGLLPIDNKAFLEVNGWSMAFWTALDEGKNAGQNIGIVALRNSDPPVWQGLLAPFKEGGDPSDIDDSEALARWGSYIYIFGSHFGSKKGRLQAERHFVARFDESVIAGGFIAPGLLEMDVSLDAFRLHRVINDYFHDTGAFIPKGDKTKAMMVREAAANGPNVKEKDHPINIEGAAFLESGDVVLGLRLPVTSEGHPILVRVSHIDRLFDDPPTDPKIEGHWVLTNVGDAGHLTGIRALDIAGDRLFAVTGGIERKGPVFDDYENAEQEAYHHYEVNIGGAAGQTELDATDLGALDFGNVEGITIREDSSMWFVVDNKKAVELFRK